MRSAPTRPEVTAPPAGPDPVGDAAPHGGDVFPDDVNRIPLPETRRSGRARRRADRRRRAQRRILTAAAAAAAVILAVVLVAGVLRGGGGSHGGAAKGDAKLAPSVPPVLLAVHSPGVASPHSLFLLAPEGSKGGTLLLLPPGTMTEVVSLGLEPLGRALELGGPPRLQTAVGNLLGVDVAEVDVLDDAGFAAMVAATGPLTVDVPSRVEKVDAAGNVQVVFDAGRQMLGPDRIGTYLAERGSSTDLSRLARHAALWDAWLEVLAKKPAAVPAQPPALHAALAALAAGSVAEKVLPVTSIGQGDTSAELYQVEQDELADMVAAAFPRTGGAVGDRPRLQILNGVGEVGLAQRVAQKLGAGFDVRLTGNAPSFDYTGTKIVFYDPGAQAAAERVRKALGLGTLVHSRRPLSVVDVTIIVGKDFTKSP